MNPESADSPELISAYFDHALTDPECQELAVRLQNDPGAALEFARTARLHAMLEAAAPPQRTVSGMLQHRWWKFAAAAAVVAAAAVGAVWYGQKASVAPQRSFVVEQIVTDGLETIAPLPPGVKRRTVRVTAATAPPPASSLDALLSRYYVDVDPAGLTVPEALVALKSGITAVNYLGRAELASLQFGYGAAQIHPALQIPSRQPGDGEPRIVAPLPKPFTVSEYLAICGLYRSVWSEPGGIVYPGGAVSAPAAPDPGHTRVATRTFRVPPDFFTRALVPPRDPGTGPFPTAGEMAADPFKAREVGDSDRPAAAELKTVPPGFPPVATLMASRSASTVTVTADPATLDHWERILNVVSQRAVHQHYIITKFIICPPDRVPAGVNDASGLILTDEEYQKMTRELAAVAATELVGAPSIIVRRGQRSRLEIIYEVPSLETGPPYDWLGLTQDVMTAGSGELIRISGMVDLGLPAWSGLYALTTLVRSEPNPARDNGANQFMGEGVLHHQTGFDLWIPDGSTAVFSLDVATGDPRTVLACVTVRLIDVAGRPLSR